jgi:predicted RNase H-like HicB family nuclease
MITFKIEPDGNEFHAWSPELPGCHTHGRTVEEAMRNLKDAVQLYLEVKMEESIAKQTLEFA